jgi:hypothetical protein
METMPLPRRPAPPGAWVEQHLPSRHIEDVRGTTCRRLLQAGLRERIAAAGSNTGRSIREADGGRRRHVAITAGSRGIGGFVEILSGVVDAVKAVGAEPFVIPAMGSHGGATPDGQREILRRLGVGDQLGAPVRASMNTVALGRAENGAVAHVDALAAEADGVIVVGRVKTHPESAAALASGLLKMCTVGLGKQRGAEEAHSHGLWSSVRAVPKVQLARTSVICGLAVVENAYKQPVEIEVVPPAYEAFVDADERLLGTAKEHLGLVPFERLDVLLVDELGKTVSGAGMDPNVIGRWRVGDGPHVPDFRRIVVLSLTEGSLGNGLGIGLADFTTGRFVRAYDPLVSYVNLLTASEPGGNTREGPLPLALPSDRDALEVALYSALAHEPARVCRIRNTAELARLWVSEGLLGEVRMNPKLTIASEVAPMAFDETGNLL